jgi:hypothetical protein
VTVCCRAYRNYSGIDLKDKDNRDILGIPDYLEQMPDNFKLEYVRKQAAKERAERLAFKFNDDHEPCDDASYVSNAPIIKGAPPSKDLYRATSTDSDQTGK